MATQTLSFLTQGDKASRSSALDESVRSMVSSTFVQGRFRVEMPIVMASGSAATVTVWPEGNGDTFMVSDDGGSLFEVMSGAFSETIFRRVAKERSERYGASFDGGADDLSASSLWIIAYGAVQGFAPRLLGSKNQSEAQTTRKAIFWAGLLVPIPFLLAGATWAAEGPAPWLTATLIGGLLLFGFVFAINSSVHSYLILAFGSAERITRDVGFYYMANAAGRLIGTLLSGLSYQIGGLPLCLATAGVMALASWLAARRLRPV